MVKHRKRKSKAMSWFVGITLALFVLAGFTFVWDYLVLVAKPLLFITGVLLTIFIIFKLVTINQIRNKVAKKIGM